VKLDALIGTEMQGTFHNSKEKFANKDTGDWRFVVGDWDAASDTGNIQRLIIEVLCKLISPYLGMELKFYLNKTAVMIFTIREKKNVTAQRAAAQPAIAYQHIMPKMAHAFRVSSAEQLLFSAASNSDLL
jgi:hypothetical protein